MDRANSAFDSASPEIAISRNSRSERTLIAGQFSSEFCVANERKSDGAAAACRSVHSFLIGLADQPVRPFRSSSSTIRFPMFSEAVAAGEGALPM